MKVIIIIANVVNMYLSFHLRCANKYTFIVIIDNLT